MVTLSFAGGLLMGLASSIHCIGMCGGIVSVLSLSLNGASPYDTGATGKHDSADDGATRIHDGATRIHDGATRWRVAISLQGGRVAAYTAMGAIVGGLGTAGYTLIGERAGLGPATFGVMRTLAALALGWSGLALAGLAPGFAPLDRLFFAIGSALHRFRRLMPVGLGAPVAGFAWGFMPCGMVYAALLLALASGSAAGGARLMVGFGLGTAPVMASMALGAPGLRRLASRDDAGIKILRFAAGGLFIMLAVVTMLLPAATVHTLCATD